MLIVFDLDFTLWDAGGTWCDHTTPPYRKRNDHILDGANREIYLYPDVPGILNALNEKDITLALASRTHSLRVAIELLELFEVRGYFKYEEIYPGSKSQHFESLHKTTLIPYNEMFFFDDEHRNIVEVGKMGVHASLVDDGLTLAAVQKVPGLENLMA